MKAIRVREFGDADVLKLETVEDLSPSEGEVLVRVRAVGINPVDTYIRSGTYALKPDLPYTPGFDGAGVVEALGDHVEKLSVGDRVYFGGSLSGAYAEQALCRPSQLFPLPPNVSFVKGACVAVPYGTAYRALHDRAHAVAGESVLVHGASGGVGTAGVQLARGLGMTVMGTASTEEGRALVLEQGAHHVVDHSAPDYLDQVMELTKGRGVDVILEMLANVNLGKDLTVLARGGRVVVIGSRGTVEINPRDAMGREASIVGMVLLNASPEELASIHAGIYAGLENESLRPVVADVLPLGEAAEAHHRVMRAGSRGNIVLECEE